MKKDGNSTWIFSLMNYIFFLLFTAGTEEGCKMVWDINAKPVERVGRGKDYYTKKSLFQIKCKTMSGRNAKKKNPVISVFCFQTETFWSNENAKNEPP